VPFTGVIALDGPSGTGKSSVARTLARRLGARYLDTGAMYRAVTWAVLEDGVAVDDGEAVAACAASSELQIGTDPDDEWVAVGGIQIDKVIRSAHVTAAVSPVSAVPAVREILVAAQRELIGAGGIVVEGRDIGTVVVPDAPLKVYLTASPEVRALRRARQEARTSPEDLAATAEAIRRRDEYDSSRPTSPLRPAQDAVVFDTSDLDEEQVVQRLVDMAISRGLVTGLVDGPGADGPGADGPGADDPAADRGRNPAVSDEHAGRVEHAAGGAATAGSPERMAERDGL
jgi:CMP/dCMP kinase